MFSNQYQLWIWQTNLHWIVFNVFKSCYSVTEQSRKYSSCKMYFSKNYFLVATTLSSPHAERQVTVKGSLIGHLIMSLTGVPVDQVSRHLDSSHCVCFFWGVHCAGWPEWPLLQEQSWKNCYFSGKYWLKYCKFYAEENWAKIVVHGALEDTRGVANYIFIYNPDRITFSHDHQMISIILNITAAWKNIKSV